MFQRIKSAVGKNKKNKSQDTNSMNNEQVWDKPRPLESTTTTALKFNEDLLPEPILSYVINEARRMDNAVPDFAAMAVLVCASALIGGTAGITPKRNDVGWVTYLTLWGIAVGDPSMKKTPLLNVGRKLLDFAQKNFIDYKNIQNIELQKIKLALYEKEVEELREKAKAYFEKGDEKSAKEAIDKLSKMESVVVGPRDIIVNDTTVEALAQRLKSNPYGVLMYKDELSSWFEGLSKQGRELERGFYLEGFDASKSKYKQDRVGRENLELQSVTLSVLGGIQPKVLKPILIARDRGVSDDGLLERFQLAVFPEKPDMKYIDEQPNQQAIDDSEAVFLKLAELGEQKSRIFSFDDDAQKIWNNWAAETATKLGELEPDWQSVVGKHPALLAKLSLIFHLIEETKRFKDRNFDPELRISSQHIKRGIKWMEYLYSHTKKIITYGRNQSQDASAMSLVKNLHKFGESFTKHQLTQKGWEGLKTKESRNNALIQLEDAGYIKSATNPKRYLIHPDYQRQ